MENCKKKFCISLIEHVGNLMNSEKKKNVVVNRRGATMTTRFNGMLHLQKKIYSKAC